MIKANISKKGKMLINKCSQLYRQIDELQQSNEEKDKEIERLKRLIKRIYDGESLPDNYEQFKTENNL